MTKLTLKEKSAYGAGDLGCGFMFDLGQSFLLKFYTDVCGISGVAAAGVFFFTKIFDAFMDPLAGSYLDKRKRSKSGKFKPVMMFASLFLALSTVISFLSPDISMQGKLVFAYASYMLFGVLYSFTNIPYGSLSSVMTQDVNDRTLLASFRQGGSLLALVITSAVFMRVVDLFPNEKMGYPISAGIMSIIGVFCFYFTFKNTKEVIEPTRIQNYTVKEQFAVVTKNKPLLILILMSLLNISAYNIKIAIIIYYCEYYLGDKSIYSLISPLVFLSSILSIFIVPAIVKRLGKKQTALIGFGISIAADLINFIIPSNVISFAILSGIATIAIGLPNLLTWAFISDVIDYGEWKNNTRSEGITYGVFSFARKLGQAISGAVSGIGLTYIGYKANVVQSATTLLGMKSLLMLYPALAVAASFIIIMFFYPITDQKYKEMIYDIEQRKLAAD